VKISNRQKVAAFIMTAQALGCASQDAYLKGMTGLCRIEDIACVGVLLFAMAVTRNEGE
jgi:hypothetical protein